MDKINTEYEHFLYHINNFGIDKGDRTGTGTRSVFGYQMRFDLAKGFPLVTTKKVHLKSIIAELLWFLTGSTNNNDLLARGCTIWNEWRAPYLLDRKMVLVPKKTPVPTVPYTGNFSAAAGFKVDSVDAKLASTWVKMMRRCYDPTYHRYGQYGARGATVAQEWHDVCAFVESVKTIPHWHYKNANWDDFELDKDYWGAFQYGPTTTIWQHRKLNTPASTGILIVSPDSKEMLGVSLADAAKKAGVSCGVLHRIVTGEHNGVFKGKNAHLADWTFTVVSEDSDLLIRPEITQDGELGPIYGYQWRSWPVRATYVNDTGKRVLGSESSIDQISQAVHLLKTDPDSRRIIVSAWNVADLDQMALMPCHALFQFYSRELSRQERIDLHVKQIASGDFKHTGSTESMDEHLDNQNVPRRALSCQLYQRSADAFLGVPFNIASYALLTMMMAQQTNHAPGEFVWTGGDCHIYDNHKDQVLEQLSRAPRPAPHMHIARKPASIFDYQPEDFVLTGYDPHPAIKAPVAV